MSSLDEATHGVYLPGISIILSPHTKDDVSFNSARRMSERKACAREVLTNNEATAGMLDVEGSLGSLSSSAIPSRALASMS